MINSLGIPNNFDRDDNSLGIPTCCLIFSLYRVSRQAWPEHRRPECRDWMAWLAKCLRSDTIRYLAVCRRFLKFFGNFRPPINEIFFGFSYYIDPHPYTDRCFSILALGVFVWAKSDSWNIMSWRFSDFKNWGGEISDFWKIWLYRIAGLIRRDWPVRSIHLHWR